MDAFESDPEKGEEGVGVVADVEEDFFDVLRLEDLLEGYVIGFGGCEGSGTEGVDVDEVDFGGQWDEEWSSGRWCRGGRGCCLRGRCRCLD